METFLCLPCLSLTETNSLLLHVQLFLCSTCSSQSQVSKCPFPPNCGHPLAPHLEMLHVPPSSFPLTQNRKLCYLNKLFPDFGRSGSGLSSSLPQEPTSCEGGHEEGLPSWTQSHSFAPSPSICTPAWRWRSSSCWSDRQMGGIYSEGDIWGCLLAVMEFPQ